MTKIDIIIAAFNSEDTIGAAVRSAFKIADASVTVVDDGSTDNTAQAAREDGATVISQTNQGASAARANGLLQTSAPLVTFLDADDELIAAGVHHSIEMLNDDQSAVVCAGRIEGFTAAGELGIRPRHFESVTPETLIRTGFGPWPPAAAVVRRIALVDAAAKAPTPLNTRYAEDYELIIRLARVGDVLMHEMPSMRYRMYDGKSSTAAEAALRDKERIRGFYAEALGIKADLLTEKQLRAAGKIRAARVSFSKKRYLSALGSLAHGALINPIFVLRKVTK
ncbi:glycosyltransferase family 2 protein [Microbacterium sp. A84]|uniref:glycosyltransferase family 2 protein n=1 Tax=Microbacterium sp. A84 TaxID=3450715 RepID=UPI003F41F45B